MTGRNIFFNSPMKTNTEYNPADAGKTFNASVNFWETQKEISREQRESANDFVQKLIDHTKATIQENE